MPQVTPDRPERPESPAAKPDPVLAAILNLVTKDEVKVPPIPSVVSRLSEHLRNPEIDLRAVTQMVGTDQALSAHILRCASGTLLAARGQVTSLNEAVMRVGTNGLFSLAVSFCLGKDAARSSPLQSLRRDLFRKAAATAEFSRRLAQRHGADPDGAFLCGLLGSFGLTVAIGAIEQVLHANPKLKQSRPAESWMSIARRCDEEAAGSVAAKWGMPKLLTDVITARRSGEIDRTLAPYVAVLQHAERLTEVFYNDAAPREEDIANALGCSAAEAGEIARFLPEVAASVLAQGSAADDHKMTQSIQIPVVDAPPSTLRGELVPASIPVTVERKGGDQQLVCVGLAADGFVAHGTQPLPLNQVVKCRLLGIDEDLELVAFVAAVLKENDYRFEMKPMGLVGGHARSWQKLRCASGKEFSASEGLDLAAPRKEPPGQDPEELESDGEEAIDLEAPASREPAGNQAASRQGGYVSLHVEKSIFKRLKGIIRRNDA
jgi:HD-like signal output (HDOD) protein